MPVRPCTEDGQPGFRWGDSGVCYTYDPNSQSSKERARQRALDQGQAILAQQEGRAEEATVRPLRETPAEFANRLESMSGAQRAREGIALGQHLDSLRVSGRSRHGKWRRQDFERVVEGIIDWVVSDSEGERDPEGSEIKGDDGGEGEDDDRAAQEAVQRAIEGLVEPMCGRVTESVGDIPSEGWPIVIIEAGLSQNRNFWSADLLRQKAQEAMDGAPVEEYEIGRPDYRHHIEAERLRELPDGVLLNPVGQVVDVRWEDDEGGSPPTQEEAEVIAAVTGMEPDEVIAQSKGRLVGRFIPDDSERGRDFVSRVRSAEARGTLDRYLGFSVDFERAKPQWITPPRSRPIRYRQDIDLSARNVLAVVTERSAGGRFIAA